MTVCCIACVGCRREPETATPIEELTVSELEELLRQKKSKIEALTVSELEELLRQKKSNAVKTAEPLSTGQKKDSYSQKPPLKNSPPPKVDSDSTIVDWGNRTDGTTFNWGSVLQGEVVTHEFEIRNPGLTPLIIENVKPACGCTKGDWTKTIAPGGTGKVELSVETIKFSGKIRKIAQVITKAQGKVILALAGMVEVPIVQEPPPDKRGLIKVSGVPIEQMKITLTKGTEKTFKINRVSCPNKIGGRQPLVSLELLEFEGGSHYELVVTPQLPLVLDANNSAQHYTANIVANVTVEGKTFDLPLNVPITVKRRIDVNPVFAYFGYQDMEELDKPGAPPVTKEILIKSLHPAHSFNITGVRYQGEHIKTRIETVTPGKEYKLVVELAKKPKATENKKIMEDIFVDTDDDDPNLQEFKITAIFNSNTTKTSGGKEPTKNNPAPNATGGSS
jgi:hypothetical protein